MERMGFLRGPCREVISGTRLELSSVLYEGLKKTVSCKSTQLKLRCEEKTLCETAIVPVLKSVARKRLVENLIN
jgi:hypothetical protein